MRKNLWMLGMAVAALTSCTQSEVLDIAESKTINFDSFVGKQTRATNDVGQTENFDVFYVYAAKGEKENNSFVVDNPDGATFFNGEKVHRTKITTGTSSSWSNWTYATSKPWTVDKTYRFAAYANGHGVGNNENPDPAKLTTGVTFNPRMENVTLLSRENLTETWGLEFSSYEAGETDLIVSVPNEEKRSTTAELVNTMNLTFDHALAKVIFRFVLDQNAGEDLEVTIDPFSLEAIKISDCLVYNNPNLTSTTNKTEINWASQNIKATDAASISAASESHIAIDDYVVVPEGGGLVLEKDDENTDIVEDDQSIAFYVIPQSNDITVTFKGTSKDGNGNTVGTTTFGNVSLKITDHDKWLPGYVYRYTASLNPQINYIHFAASVTAWTDEPNRDQGIVGSATGQNN